MRIPKIKNIGVFNTTNMSDKELARILLSQHRHEELGEKAISKNRFKVANYHQDVIYKQAHTERIIPKEKRREVFKNASSEKFHLID